MSTSGVDVLPLDMRRALRLFGLARRAAGAGREVDGCVGARAGSDRGVVGTDAGDTASVMTMRLDAERSRRLVAYGARFTPRRTNQDILVAALDAFLNRTP
jgi:hypothetical protein